MTPLLPLKKLDQIGLTLAICIRVENKCDIACKVGTALWLLHVI